MANSAYHDLVKWQVFLRDGGKSPYSGKPGIQMHEEWITRYMVMGMCDDAREAIFEPENCVLLTPDENTNITHEIHAANRRHLIRVYGVEHLQAWISHFCDEYGYRGRPILLEETI